jgi:hypothetical protein
MSSGMTKSIHHAPLARALAARVGVAHPVTGEDDRAQQLVEDIVRDAPRRPHPRPPLEPDRRDSTGSPSPGSSGWLGCGPCRSSGSI